MSAFEQTLRQSVTIEGVGLHTGLPSKIVIYPSEPGSGISFFRAGQPSGLASKACVENVDIGKGQGRQTALCIGDTRVHTVEHLMAVFHGLGIDNARIEIEGNELPGLDGSAKEYLEAIKRAGIVAQAKERQVFVVEEPFFVKGKNYSLALLPNPTFAVSYTLSYDRQAVPDQFVHFEITPEVFESDIAPARTFCLKEEAEALLAQGYGRGANLQNTLVFDAGKPVGNELRFEHEAARHKVLDILGDLYLFGQPIRGHVIACRTGHKQNYELISMLKAKLASSKNKEVNSSMTQYGPELSAKEIQNIIPHRYPFLLVDRIVEFQPGKRAVGIKNVTMNEPFFQGHFPGHPVMPGVLIVEAMAQVEAVVMLSLYEKDQTKIAYFMSIDNAKFRQPVFPGDTMRLEVEVLRARSRTGQCAGKAYVNGKLVCEAEMKFAVVDVAAAQKAESPESAS